MEHDSSYEKRLRKEITVSAVKNQDIRISKAEVNKNDEKIDEMTQEINRIKTAICRKRQKHQHHRELSLRLIKLNFSKLNTKNKIDALKQTLTH